MGELFIMETIEDISVAKIPVNSDFERRLGLFESVMFGIGGMIGAGVFALSGLLAYELQWFAIFSLMIAAMLSILTGYVYGYYSSKIHLAGGGYNFVKNVLGERVAVFSGWWFFVAYSFAGAFYAGVFGIYLEILTGVPYYMFSIVMILFFAIVNYIGVKESGTVEGLLTMFKISVIVSILIAGYYTLGAGLSNISSPKIDPFDIIIYAAIMFIALEGFDIISTLSEEIKEPEKNVPRAIYISIISVVIMYILIVILDVIVVEKGVPSGILMEEIILQVASQALGKIGYFLLITGALISTLSAYNATIIAASRVAYALALDGHFPTILNNIHSKNRTPHIAVITSSVLVFLIIVYVHSIAEASAISSSLGSISSLSFLLAFSTIHVTFLLDKEVWSKNNQINYRGLISLLGLTLTVIFSILLFASNPLASISLIALTPVGIVLSKLNGKNKKKFKK